MPDPWNYAAKTRNEYAEQVALFMWSNMAANFGLTAASRLESYTVKGYAVSLAEQHNDRLPILKRLFAIKNAEKGGAIRGAMSVAEGVKSGVPDVMLPVIQYPGLIASRLLGHTMGPPEIAKAFAGLWIELKRLKSERGAKGVASDNQADWHDYLRGAGYRVEVCYGWEAARDVILDYLGGTANGIPLRN